MAQSGRPSLFSTKMQEGHFFIDNQRVNGHWQADLDKKQFRFYWDVKRNPPAVNRMMRRKLGSHASTMQLRVPFPIMKESHQIDVGFLTAGYLMFFAMFGYSWVLQAHLDPIRKQILHPGEEIIRAKYLANTNIVDKGPWVGFMRLLNFHVPTFGFMKSVVLYPPMYHPTLYSELGDFDQKIDPSDICAVKFADKPKYNKRLIVLVDDKVMIAPDWTNKEAEHIDVIQFMYGSNTMHTFRPVGPEEYRSLQSNPSCKTLAIRLRSHDEPGGTPRGGNNEANP
jgi:hypothetical protein